LQTQPQPNFQQSGTATQQQLRNFSSRDKERVFSSLTSQEKYETSNSNFIPFDEHITTKASITLDEMIDMLPMHLHECETPEDKHFVTMQMMNKVDLSTDPSVWRKHAIPDYDIPYSRNLVATDNETYSLLCLVWNPSMGSPIHDHPCDGCWVQVLEGDILEKRYQPAMQMPHAIDGVKYEEQIAAGAAEVKRFDEIGRDNFHRGQTCFLEDPDCFHSIHNPNDDRRAVTMHLYSPPMSLPCAK
jgi:predicted metal-dependent enzyme (double-stranded beta helix superfamily)